jgi:hypothetical protein
MADQSRRGMLFHFYYDPNSLKGNPFGFVDKWIIFQHGEPFLMAQRSTLPLDEVLEICGNMLLSGWKKCERYLGDATYSKFDEPQA